MYFREQRKANGVCIITEGGKYFPGIGVGGGKCTYVLGFVSFYIFILVGKAERKIQKLLYKCLVSGM